MARPAFVQTPGGTTVGPGTALNLVSYSAPITMNSISLVFIRQGGTGDLITAVDDSLHAYSQLYNVVTAANRFTVWGSRKTPSVALGQGIEVSLSSSATIRGFGIEYSDVTTGTIIDADQFGTLASGVTQTAPAVSTGFTDEIIIAAICADTAVTGDFTAISPFTERIDYNQRLQVQEADGTSTGSFVSAWTLGTASAVAYVVLALKSATSVAPTPAALNRLGLMGVG